MGLLGTRFTMEGAFYRDRLADGGVTTLVPDEPDRSLVHDVIYDELVQGIVEPTSRARVVAVIERLAARGAEGIIAGCTEIELLVTADDVSLPYFPTTRLHALAAARWALGEAAEPWIWPKTASWTCHARREDDEQVTDEQVAMNDGVGG